MKKEDYWHKIMLKETKAWEQRKVGEYLVESRELGHKGDAARKMTVKLWGKGVYEKNETGSSNTQYFVRHANQFIYSKLDFLNCAFGVVPEELESLETTADVPVFDCYGIDPYFMFYTAIQPQFYLKNGTIADGSRKAKRIHFDRLFAQLKSFTRYEDSMLEEYGITEDEYYDYAGHYLNVLGEIKPEPDPDSEQQPDSEIDPDYELMAYSHTKIDYEYIINLIQNIVTPKEEEGEITPEERQKISESI